MPTINKSVAPQSPKELPFEAFQEHTSELDSMAGPGLLICCRIRERYTPSDDLVACGYAFIHAISNTRMESAIKGRFQYEIDLGS